MRYALPLVLTMAVATVCAGDWAEFHGPNRDNKSTDQGLLKTWPEGGPSRIWEAAGSEGLAAGSRPFVEQVVRDAGRTKVSYTELASGGAALWFCARGARGSLRGRTEVRTGC